MQSGLLVVGASLKGALADKDLLATLSLPGPLTLLDASQAEALLAAEPDGGAIPAVVLFALSDLEQPLALARRMHRIWPLASLVFDCVSHECDSWRLAVGPGPALGRHWSVLDESDPQWTTKLRETLAGARRRQQSRTTLDRANARMAASPPVLNATEYQRLVASTQHLANFLRYSQDAVFGLDSSRAILFWNHGAERLLGIQTEDVIGRHVTDLDGFGPALQASLALLDAGAPTATLEYELAADGQPKTLEFLVSAVQDASSGGASVFVHDVTMRHAAEARLREANEELETLVSTRTRELQTSQQALLQAQKLESIGKLTGGVAHDFNNVLQIIGSNLQLLLAAGKRPEHEDHYLRACLRAVGRGAKLTAQLLAFARRQPLNPAPVNLNRLVRDIDDLLRRSLGEDIHIETSLAGGLWTTFADAAQLENVILNLAINSRDAMPPGGRLTIETANATLDEAYTDPLGDVSPGQYVMLAVSDTGIGMPPDVVAQAFEPFFTTKPEGKGTGLGLSMAYGFAKQSSGHIRIYSEVGSGTTIRLYLPRTHAQENLQVPIPRGPMTGGSETILVVEDDLEVQEAAVNMLAGLGYTVLRANDAQAALEILEDGARVDLLFTDVVMPGPLRSPDLMQRARQLLPGIAVLFTSGYTQNAIVHGGRLDPGVELLSKPYRHEDLARRVRQLLAQRPVLAPEPTAPAGQPVPEPTSATRASILFVEDDPDARATMHLYLEMLGYPVVSVDSEQAALSELKRSAFDILLTDISLVRGCGISLAEQAVAMHPALKVIFASGHGRPENLPTGFPSWYLTKPYVDKLEETLARVQSI